MWILKGELEPGTIFLKTLLNKKGENKQTIKKKNLFRWRRNYYKHSKKKNKVSGLRHQLGNKGRGLRRNWWSSLTKLQIIHRYKSFLSKTPQAVRKKSPKRIQSPLSEDNYFCVMLYRNVVSHITPYFILQVPKLYLRGISVTAKSLYDRLRLSQNFEGTIFNFRCKWGIYIHLGYR